MFSYWTMDVNPTVVDMLARMRISILFGMPAIAPGAAHAQAPLPADIDKDSLARLVSLERKDARQKSEARLRFAGRAEQ
jgi:hypothetical protein